MKDLDFLNKYIKKGQPTKDEINRDFLVDVASDRNYQNTSPEYQKAYTKWRNTPDNKYAYTFVHDSREHVYIEGEGYADEFASEAEKKSLSQCVKFLSKIMFMILGFQIIKYFAMFLLFNRPYISYVYASQADMRNDVISSEQIYIYCAFRLIMALAAIFVTAKKLKLPAKVAVPCEKINWKNIFLGAACALIFLVLGRCFDYALKYMFGFVLKIDITVSCYANAETLSSQLVYFFTDLLIFPALAEILYRGYFLQLFRQFGDRFAILITAICSACYYHDISKIMFIFGLSIITGAVMIKNGNIFAAIFTKLIALNFEFILNNISFDDQNLRNKLFEILISLLIVISSFHLLNLLHKRMITPFSLEPDGTELNITQKVSMTITSGIFGLFLVATLVGVILNVRFSV